MNDRNQRFRKGEVVASISAITLLALSILKGGIALMSGSVALLADSVHTFADIFSSVAVWIGLRLVQKKPTDRFPYGFYKAESFSLFMVSITITVSGILILVETSGQIFEPNTITSSNLVLTVAALSGLTSYLLGIYKKRVGRSIGSQSLIGEGQHSLVDVCTSILVFIGVYFSSLGYPVVEDAAGLVIGVNVIKMGVSFGKDAALVLMDACVSPDRLKELKEIALRVQGVSAVHAVRMRKSGPVTFGEMHLKMDKGLPFEKAHSISNDVEERIRKQFPDVESMAIHIEASQKERLKIGIPILENKGLESLTSAHFGTVPFFIFLEAEKGQVINSYVKMSAAGKLDRKRGITTAQLLVDEKIDVLLAYSLGEGPFHLLRDNLVEIYHLPSQMSVKNAVNMLNQKNLERMTAPMPGE
jgi:cation diffusion facilitator family transporter